MIKQFAAGGSTDFEVFVNDLSINTIGLASISLIVLLILAGFTIKNKAFHHLKLPLFVLIAATIVVPSVLLVVSTVYVNVNSESKGPVHWHTDFEIWACGQEVELRNPTGFLSNKIGTATYHEHDDKRIHLEGVVVEKSYDASLEKFFDVTDGAITPRSITVATEASIIENDTDGDESTGDPGVLDQYLTQDENGLYSITLNNGDACGDGVAGELQVYLLRLNDDERSYTQTRLQDPRTYIMRDESIVPPGDCVIIEFAPPQDATNKLCQQYGVRDIDRCTEFGVSEFNPELCQLRQIVSTGGDQ